MDAAYAVPVVLTLVVGLVVVRHIATRQRHLESIPHATRYSHANPEAERQGAGCDFARQRYARVRASVVGVGCDYYAPGRSGPGSAHVRVIALHVRRHAVFASAQIN